MAEQDEQENTGVFNIERLKAPFPYFGGKSKIAATVWQALGQPRHYIEPFFGSGAVLLARPGFDMGVHVETVNDADGNIANVWRSIQYSPDETAKWCDWPVNHADLCARRKAIIADEERLLANLIADPEWHDPKIAGYWIWAASCWIGSGLTSESGKKRPHLGKDYVGKGVHTIHPPAASGKRPRLTGFAETGVNAIGIEREREREREREMGIGKIPEITVLRGCLSNPNAHRNNGGVFSDRGFL